MTTIADEIRTKCGKANWPIPEMIEGQPDKWLRFQCPFCLGGRSKRKDTGAINYAANWFSCFSVSCNANFGTKSKVLPYNDTELSVILARHKRQIRSAVHKVARKYGQWVDVDELISYACQMIWNYACRPYGGPNDAGMYEEWIGLVGGDLELMHAYIGKALYGDLMNEAQRTVVWKRKTQGVSDGYEESSVDPLSDDKGNTELDYRVSQHGTTSDKGSVMSGASAYSRAIIDYAESEEIPFGSWGSEILRCPSTRSGFGPNRGCCRWCDRKLKPLKNS